MVDITSFIVSWMEDRAHNRLAPDSELPAFDSPLVGIAGGEDPLFTFLQNDIGPEFYWTPATAFAQAFPKQPAQPQELSVIAWVLPQTEQTRLAHRQERELPSPAWSKARHYGEQVNEGLRRAVVERLRAAGMQACAPTLLPQWAREISTRYGFASSWSERHAAHVCGLGTFGLSDGLITPAGKAVRVGSVVVRARYPASHRDYTSHDEWCLHSAGGKCLACIRRCPVGAISESGHDKEKCKTYIRSVTSPYVERQQLGFPVNSCGLCQTKVPCEHRNPRAARTSPSQPKSI